MAAFQPGGREWSAGDVGSWFGVKPGFTETEDYFNPNTYSGGWEDVRQSISDKILKGTGQFATDRTRKRLGQDVLAMQGLAHLNSVLGGSFPGAKGDGTPTSMLGVAQANLPEYLKTGKMPGVGVGGSPSNVWQSLLDMSQNAQAGGNEDLWKAINDDPDILAGLREYGQRSYGGFAGRRFQDMVEKMGIAGAEAGLGEGYTTGLYGSPYVTQTGPTPPMTTPPVPGAPPPITTPAPETTAPTGPIADVINNTFSSAIGRPATEKEQAFWQNKMNTVHGGGPAGLNQIILDIQNSQPAARYRTTGQAAPTVNNPADAASFYNWLFAGDPAAPPREAWIQKYLGVLGLPMSSGVLRFPSGGTAR